jgi:hypothetical protein
MQYRAARSWSKAGFDRIGVSSLDMVDTTEVAGSTDEP